MRNAALITLWLFVALGCHHKSRNKEPRYGNNSGTYESAPPPPATGGYQATGTCDSACQHYLQCKGINDPTTQNQCVTKCAQAGYKPQALDSFLKTDCASAIFIVEGSGNKAGGSAGGGGATTGKECQGCVWDGSSCIWMSSGNWGSGPYSGAYTACNAACCPGH